MESIVPIRTVHYELPVVTLQFKEHDNAVVIFTIRQDLYHNTSME